MRSYSKFEVVKIKALSPTRAFSNQGKGPSWLNNFKHREGLKIYPLIPVLDEVLLEPAGDLLVWQGRDGHHGAELAVQAVVEPVKLLVPPGHLHTT